jgi:peptidoglycan/xylan/chitin deacetylase (PgdA/CDA1 family)
MKSALYRAEEKRGATYVGLWRKDPSLLPRLLGNFYDTSPRGVALRRLFLALHIPPLWLEIAGRWIVDPAAKEKWLIFLRQYCFWRGVQRAIADRETWKRLTYGVPILMYHAFAEKGEAATRYVLPIRDFKLQMRALRLLRYRVISLDEYLDCLVRGQLPPARSVILTIDDGYQDNYLLVYPVLKQLDLPATIFLVSAYLGKTNRWDRDSVLTGRALFDRADAQEMQENGVSLGAHTRSHPALTRLSNEEMMEEICLSKVELEQILGRPLRLFSYPYGEYDHDVATVVQEACFEAACTTDTGLNTFQTPLFALRRTEIFGTFSLWRFLRAVSSGT